MGGKVLSKSFVALIALAICVAFGLGAGVVYASDQLNASSDTKSVVTDAGDSGTFASIIPLAQSLDGAVVTVDPDSYVFTTKSITPTSVTVTLNGVTLTVGTDYTLSYENNKNVGTATVVVTGAGDYAGAETTATFAITEADINDCKIGSFLDQKATGEPLKPTVTISDDRYASAGKQGTVLKQDEDYTIAYENNVKVGTATVTITGIGNYTGTAERTFEITPFLTIFKQVGEDGEPEAVATYNQAEFEALAQDDRTPVSAMFWQDDSGGWKVASSNWYVTLDELFDSLDVYWGEGSSLAYGGDDDSGKGGQVYTYEEIIDQGWFFPDASGHDSNNPDNKVKAPAILTVREYSQMSGTSEAETAQDAENYNIEHRSDADEPRILYGITEDGYLDPVEGWETTRGLRYWSRCSYLTVIEPEVENPLADAVVTVEEGDWTFTKSAIKPDVTVTLNGATLTETTDYTVSYSDNTNAGTATITITGAGDYEGGEAEATFTIAPADMSVCTIGTFSTTAKATGDAIEPSPTIRDNRNVSAGKNGPTLVVGTDYTIDYENNVEPGTATIIFTGMGNYTGTITKTFTIIPYLVIYKQIGEDGEAEAMATYNQKEFEALTTDDRTPVSGMFYQSAWRIVSSNWYVTLDELFDGIGIYWGAGASLAYGGDDDSGKGGQEYTYEAIAEQCYFFPDASGTASNNPDNKVDAPAILAVTTNSVTTGSSPALTAADAQEYNIANRSNGQEPRIFYGISEDDYKNKENVAGLRYWDNCSFLTVIEPENPLESAVVTVEDGDWTFTKSAITPGVTVTLNGTELEAGTDYTVSYSDNTNAGSATITITGAGDYEGGEAEATFTIAPADMSVCTIGTFSTTAKATGDPIKPSPTIRDNRNVSAGKNGPTLVVGTDYTIAYENNVEPGTATIIFTGMGNYTGTITKTFTIIPYLVIYKQEGADGEPEAVATYNQKEFEALTTDDREPVSGMFWQSAWRVVSSNWYVTLDELFEEVGIYWGAGASLAYGGDDDSGKGGQEYTYETITDQGWFFPDASGAASNNPNNKVEAPAILAVTTNSVTTGSSPALTAADAQTYNIENRNNGQEPRLFYGISEDGYLDPEADITTTRGLRYWDNCSYVTVIEPENLLAGAVVTVEEGDWVYTGTEIEPGVTVTLNGTTLSEGTDYTVSYSSNTNAGIATVIITGAGDYAGSETSATFEIAKADINDCTISNISDQKATGEPIEPTLTITDNRYANVGQNGPTLIEGIDYTLTYEHNIEVGTATVTINGTGNYTNAVVKTFKIIPYLVLYRQEGADGEPEAVASYNQKEFETLSTDDRTPVSGMYYDSVWNVVSTNWYVTLDDLFEAAGVTWGVGASLAYGGEDSSGKGGQIYTYETITDQGWFFPDASGTASNNPDNKVDAPAVLAVTTGSVATDSSSAATAADAQAYNIDNRNNSEEPRIIYGISEEDYLDPTADSAATRDMRYQSNCSYLTVIVPEYESINDATVTLSEDEWVYTGTAIEPDVTVTLGGTVLEKDTDYTVSYSDNVKAGTATVKVEGCGHYTGSVSATFTIMQADINDCNIGSIADEKATGEPIEPTLTINDYRNSVAGKQGHVLVLNQDYTVAFENNIEVGTATVTINGIGNYTGTAQTTFEIVPYLTIYVQEGTDGEEVAVASYNKAEYEALATPDSTPVSGMFWQGDSGTWAGGWKVTSSDYYVTLEDLFQNLGIYWGPGATLLYGGDDPSNDKERQSYSYETIASQCWFFPDASGLYSNNPDNKVYAPAVLTVTEYSATTGSGGDVEGTAADAQEYNLAHHGTMDEPRLIYGISEEGYLQNEMTSINRGLRYWSRCSYVTVVLPDSVTPFSDAVVTGIDASYTYTGSAIAPVPTVTLDGEVLSVGTDYTVSYENNVNVGTATVVITPAGEWAGQDPIKVTFTIVAAEPTTNVMTVYAGADRYATADAIAAAVAEAGTYEGVIVCSAESGKYADALCASGLSGVLDYPIVLTKGSADTLDAATADAISALFGGGKGDVIVLGGTSTISVGIRNGLADYDTGGAATRIAGDDRYATAEEVYTYGAKHGSGWSTDYAVLAIGNNFPDALGAASFCTTFGTPMLLTNRDSSTLETYVQNATAGVNEVIIAGGTTSIPDQKISGITNTVRLAGDDRYETNLVFTSWELEHGMSLDSAGVATGTNFPDSLGSSYLLSLTGSVLLLSSPDDNAALYTMLSNNAENVHYVSIFGGTDSVSESVRASIEAAIGGTWEEVDK